MTPALVEHMQKAELSTTFMSWPDTPFRTIRSLTNAQAGERGAEAAEEFYMGLIQMAHQLLNARGGPHEGQAAEDLAAALAEVGFPRQGAVHAVAA